MIVGGLLVFVESFQTNETRVGKGVGYLLPYPILCSTLELWIASEFLRRSLPQVRLASLTSAVFAFFFFVLG